VKQQHRAGTRTSAGEPCLNHPGIADGNGDGLSLEILRRLAYELSRGPSEEPSRGEKCADHQDGEQGTQTEESANAPP
jgi:hypothetical protein